MRKKAKLAFSAAYMAYIPLYFRFAAACRRRKDELGGTDGRFISGDLFGGMRDSNRYLPDMYLMINGIQENLTDFRYDVPTTRAA